MWERIEREIKKNLAKRLKMWTVLIIIGILLDEYLKEGYIFNPKDLATPLSHEQLIITIVLIRLVLNKLIKKFGGGCGGNNG